MTDGTSQGLFIVVAIVIFGIFVVLAYILFEDTLSPALANMFTDASEQSQERLESNRIGENLLNNTGGSNLEIPRDTSWVDRIDVINGKNTLVYKNRISALIGDYELIPGETYTFSYKAMATSPLHLESVYINRVNKDFTLLQPISTEWETYSFSFTAKNNDNPYDNGYDNHLGQNHVYIHMYPVFNSLDDELYVTEWKLELGDRATKWVK